MTIREFMTAVIAVEGMPADLCQFAESEIAKLDARNAKRAEKPSKTALANEPIKMEIISAIENLKSPVTASVLVDYFGDKYTVQKVSSLCVQLEKEGKLVSDVLKVKGKGKQKGYTIADTIAETESEAEVE